MALTITIPLWVPANLKFVVNVDNDGAPIADAPVTMTVKGAACACDPKTVNVLGSGMTAFAIKGTCKAATGNKVVVTVRGTASNIGRVG